MRVKRLAKEGGWVAFGQLSTLLGALMLVRVLTEHLDPTQYGQLALGLTIAGLVNQVVTGGISAGIGRFYPIARENRDLSGYVQSCRQLMRYATIAIFCLGTLLLAGLYLLGYNQWMGLATTTLLLSLLNGYHSSITDIQNAARDRKTVALHGGIAPWLKIVFAVAVMFWLGRSSTAVVIGYSITSLVVTTSQLSFLLKSMPYQPTEPATSVPWLQQMWTFSWPFSAWGIFTWAQQASDRWALAAFASSQDVGFYAVLFQVGYTPISLVTTMAINFAAPILYQRAGNATNRAHSTHVNRIVWSIVASGLLITLAAFALAMGLHGRVFTLLTTEDYRTASYLLPWMILAGGLFASGQLLALKLTSELRSKDMLWVKIITAILGVVLNFCGAKIAGLQGVTVAFMVFSGTYFSWMAWLSRNRLGASPN